MARPKGTPKTGGRQKGTQNRITADIKGLAQSFGDEAIKSLIEIVRDSEAPHAARVAAIREVLDRGYGKAKQGVELTGDGGGPVGFILEVSGVDPAKG